MPRNERIDQPASNGRRVLQRLDHGGDAESEPRLTQIAIERAQPVGLDRAEPCRHDQAVECIVFGAAIEHRRQRSVDRFGAPEQVVDAGVGRLRHEEIVDETQPPAVKRRRHFLKYPKTEVLEHRNRVGKHDRSLALVQLEPHRRLTPVAMEARGAARCLTARERA